jgi:hypothetical protein
MRCSKVNSNYRKNPPDKVRHSYDDMADPDHPFVMDYFDPHTKQWHEIRIPVPRLMRVKVEIEMGI